MYKGLESILYYIERRWRFVLNDKLGLVCFGIDVLIEMGVMVVEGVTLESQGRKDYICIQI